MRKTLILFNLLFIIISITIAQNSKDVLLTIGDEKVTSDEFLRIYNKNNNIDNQIDPKTIDEYLELFVNFKLKVLEAESLGMDTLSSFINELSGYREQLTKPYLRDDSFDDLLVKEAYERTKNEVHASHIMVRVDEFAPPKDTLLAYEKIMAIRQRVIKGEPFDVVAKATSDDPSAQQNGGDLGYFSAFRMVYPFETAAFLTPVGEVSMPVRTRFGYHIIKVYDKRPSLGSVQVSHIMVATPETMSQAQQDKAKEKALKLYGQIKNGTDFAKLAKEESDDKGSGRNGGVLRSFSTGQMVPEFEQASFKLKEIGEVSEPIKTSYGWHIIKLIDKKPVPSFEEMKADLAQRIKRDQRSIVGEEVFIEKLKKEYKFEKNSDALNEFINALDSTIFTNNWNKEKVSKLNSTLFTLNSKEFKQSDFFTYFENYKRPSNSIGMEVLVDNAHKDFIDKSVIDYEKSRLETKYPEFRYLMEEYHDGILLFDLTDKMVWSKAVDDTIGLQKFYETNKKNYMWNNRVDAIIFTFEDNSVLSGLQKLAKKGIKKNYTADFIKNAVCDTLDCLTYESGKYERGQNSLIDDITWEKGVYGPIKDGDASKLIMITDVLTPMPKELNEARGIITADYQNFLEKEWIEELRAKYDISVNQEVLSAIKQSQENL